MISPKNFNLNFWSFLGILAVFFIGSFVMLTFSLRTNAALGKKVAENKELKRPAELDVTIVAETSCRECFNVSTFLENLKKQNVKIKSEKIVERMSAEGEALIKKFNIIKVPTVILSGELEKDEALQKILSQLGEIRGSDFVLKGIGGPYVLTATGEIKGEMKLTMLTDPTCVKCYDVRVHESIIKQFGATPTVELVDSRAVEGKNLIEKYGIKLLPTIVLRGDFEAYPELNNVWPQVGTVEKDGARIFRQGVKGMGVYKDLTTGKVIELQKQPAASARP